MVLVTGATGFVGQNILKMCKNAIACPSLQNLTREQVYRTIQETGLCAADPNASYQANVQLPVWIAEAAKGTKLICFSSAQVYSGLEEEGPYTEDLAKPGNVYATHKLEMEQRVLDIAPDAVMLRAEWMYDYYLKKSNYFMNILNATQSVGFSSRQYRGITYVKNVAQNMDTVMQLPGGIYNFGSETQKSMYEITQAFLTLLRKQIPLEDAPPRHNLWMNCEKARGYGVRFPSVEDGLKQCVKDHNLY